MTLKDKWERAASNEGVVIYLTYRHFSKATKIPTLNKQYFSPKKADVKHARDTVLPSTPLLNYSFCLLTFVAKRRIRNNIFAGFFVAFLHCQSHSPFTWWQIAGTTSTKICPCYSYRSHKH